MTESQTPDIRALADLAEEIAREAGALIARRRAEGVSVAASKSSPEDIVTAADREAEELIRLRLSSARPEDGFFGEESGEKESTSGLSWIVDPIDGTVNYLYGNPDYAVSIAVVEGGQDPERWTALAGVVHAPAADETYRAERGGGATLNGTPLAVPRDVPAALALVGTGFGYRQERRVWQAGILRELIAHVRDIRRMGSAALDLCHLAAGRLDAYYERGLNPWDQAAGALIATEAGAVVAGLRGRGPSADFVLAAEAPLFAELHDLLVAAGAADTTV